MLYSCSLVKDVFEKSDAVIVAFVKLVLVRIEEL